MADDTEYSAGRPDHANYSESETTVDSKEGGLPGFAAGRLSAGNQEFFKADSQEGEGRQGIKRQRDERRINIAFVASRVAGWQQPDIPKKFVAGE